MKKILIDITPTMPNTSAGHVGNYVSGIGQAAIALLDALNKMDDIPYNIELYASSFRARNYDFSKWKFKVHKFPMPSKFSNKYPKVEPFLRSLMCKYDLYHIPANYASVGKREPFIVTIHDCTDMDAANSSDVADEERALLLKKYQRVTQYSRAIVTDSQFSKSEILKYFDISPDKVIVNYLGLDRSKFCVLTDDMVKSVLTKLGISQPYIFACSCSRPRKNLVTALRAFKKFLTYHPEHIFVAAWGNPFPEIKEEFAKEISDGKIRFLPFLTDEEIVALYNGASLSVYVSRKEGFGLPILESFACGTPVMTCRNSSLPEVGQDAAIYVGEDSIDEMVDVMRIFETDSYDLMDFKKKSERVMNQFTWENTAKRCLDIYDMCV